MDYRWSDGHERPLTYVCSSAEDKRNPGLNTMEEEADNNDGSNVPTQTLSESSHEGTAAEYSAESSQASALPAPCTTQPVEGGGQQLDSSMLTLEDPPVTLKDPPMTLDDPLLTFDNHNNTLSDFRGGSQAPSSLGYDSGTPAAYWSSHASSPVSDFSGYLSNFGDMSFTAMLNAPLPYLPTAVPSSTTAAQNPAYLAPYIFPAFNFPEPSLFEAPQVVVPYINCSSSSTHGLSHPLISNHVAPGPPHLTLSNALSGAEYPPVAAPNINHSTASNPRPLISDQTAPDSLHFTPRNVPNRTDQLCPVASGPQSSEALTTAHLSQSIPAAASCPPGQETASQSNGHPALPVVRNTHDLNVADNPVLPEASPSGAENVAEIRRSACCPVPSTRADLANSIGGNAHAVHASTTAIKKRGNTDSSNHRCAK